MPTPEVPLMSDQSYSEAIGWLVHSVGREHMLIQAETAERSGNSIVSAQLRDWAERLTPLEDTVFFRARRIELATYELQEVDAADQHTVKELLEMAEAALRGAGVIR